jgi:acyl-coenzyme A synthetase/AMP-(fatty) acid ligase
MIPELAVSILACARWFHTFSCFAGFSASALASKLMTVHAKWLSLLMVAFAAKKPLI